MKSFVIAVSALSLLAGATPAFAAPCKDAHGKFAKCAPAAKPKPKVCRDAKGHFVKCAPEAKAKPKVCRDSKGHFKKC